MLHHHRYPVPTESVQPLNRWSHRVQRLSVLTVAILAATLFVSPAAFADDDEEDVAPRAAPILMVNLSQIEGMLSNMASAFESVGRDDMVGAMQGLMGQVGNLEGLDRTRSIGMAMFLPETLPPSPVGVLYVPVDDIESLIETMELGPITVRKLEDEENRYEIVSPRQTRQVVVRDGYAFISSEEAFLDADVTLLSNLAPRLAEQFDLSVTFRPNSIPPILLDVFLGFLEGQTSGQLQQRDDEPLPQYIARRANGLTRMEMLQYVLEDGEQLTLGLKADPETGGAEIELIVDAKADSAFAQYLDDLASRPSSFSPLFSSDEPLTVSASWKMGETGQTNARELVRAMSIGLQNGIYPQEDAAADSETAERTPGSSEAAPTIHPTIERLMTPLAATVDDGHIDFCAQFRAVDADRFVLIGGMHLLGGETFATGLREVLTHLKASDSAPQIELDVDRHQDVVFHRLGGDAVREQDRRLYGDDSSVYIGSSRRTLWFAVGGPDALTEVKSAIDTLATASQDPASREQTVPFQIVMRAERWLHFPESDDPEEVDRQALGREAFSEDNDTLQFEIRPTESGVVVKMIMDAGFVRMLALGLAQGYDERQ